MADDLEALILALRIQADTKEAQPKVDALADGLDRVGASAKKANQSLSGLGADKAIPASAPEQAKKLAEGIDSIAPASKSAVSGLFSLRNMARTALGTFEAMAIFLVTQFVGNTIKKAIESVSQLEQAFIRLAVAERAISSAGIDVTPKQLDDISKSVAATYQTVSEIDSKKMVANLAVLTKDLQLSAEEYRKLAMAIPLVAQQAGVSIDSATEQVINGLAKSGRGWADLGITVDAEIIKQRAVADRLVESRDAYEKLTAEQKQQIEVQALINILLDNTNENLKEQDNYLQTIEGSTKVASASWEDLLAKMAQIARPAILEALSGINETLTTLDGWLEKNKDSWTQWGAAVSAGMVAGAGMVELIYQMMAGQGISLSKISQVMQDAKDAYQTALNNPLGELSADTPTGIVPEIDTDAVEAPVEDLQGALEKMNNEILEAQLKLAQDMEDAAIDLGRRLEDITIEYAKKRAEAEIDYASKVSDINRDYANKIADINSKQQESRAKARADEQEREREHQNKLQEMREKFLMDMDDALHARDARQILKLIKQYELDKLQAERDFALKQESAAKDEQLRQKSFANERAAAERDRKAKLAEAQQDYADKLAKLRADEEAERAAAQLKYEREKQDLEKAMQDRLEIVAANLVSEFNLTQEGLNAIVSLYRQYYSEVAGIYAAMQAMMAGSAAIGASMGSNRGTYTPANRPTNGSGRQSGIKMAEGGTIIANQPTSVVFGEAGIEAATFTPIGRTGQDVNKIFSSLSGAGSGDMGGAVSIELLLSPDLESRIVSNTLNKTAQVFTKTMRSKR